MTKLVIIGLLALFCLSTPTLAGVFASLNDKGNEAYDDGRFNDALDFYHEAEIEQPETPEIYYNQANTLSKTGKYEEAIEKYMKALNSSDTALQADAYFNLGVSHIQKEDYQNAIKSFEESLKIRPDDPEAKHNLEAARILLKEQLERQSKDKKEGQDTKEEDVYKENPEGEDELNKPDEQGEDQQQNKDEQGEEQNKQEDGSEGNPGDEEAQKEVKLAEETQEQNPDEMSKEDAIRLLNSLEGMESDKTKRQYTGPRTYQGKDW
ncbi:MAG: tetratricopeptide repeat protein [Candidatus Zixiibacteriota bacterium]